MSKFNKKINIQLAQFLATFEGEEGVFTFGSTQIYIVRVNSEKGKILAETHTLDGKNVIFSHAIVNQDFYVVFR